VASPTSIVFLGLSATLIAAQIYFAVSHKRRARRRDAAAALPPERAQPRQATQTPNTDPNDPAHCVNAR
jgi:hypothetical protein